MADSRCPDMSAIDILKATQQGQDRHDWDVPWRNLANTTEPSMCGGDAALLDYFDYLLIYL